MTVESIIIATQAAPELEEVNILVVDVELRGKLLAVLEHREIRQKAPDADRLPDCPKGEDVEAPFLREDGDKRVYKEGRAATAPTRGRKSARPTTSPRPHRVE